MYHTVLRFRNSMARAVQV